MSQRNHDDEREALLQGLEHRLRMSVFSRRRLVGGAIASAGAAAVGTIPGGSAVMAQDSTPSAELDEEQVFYNSFLQNDPKSFDWNADLYCNA
ncbi:MAG TPA: hypothetical protein VD789_14170, partial [Thermomicrobiales bacterium]|nr:hypothetical protein [Thermomicrobiales bacterium]